jgi:REP element-mobilizing transposase RayT
MGRGIARRTIFLDRADCRYFLSCLAREAHRGAIAILAFSLMTTHFHVLVISLDGHLSDTMKRALSRYSRYFNRKYRRDGPLFRSRFRSKPVCNTAYRRAVLRYIDRNPVQARLVSKPWDYPWGSAARYTDQRCPPWLRNGAVPLLVQEALDLVEFNPTGYMTFYEGARHDDVAAMVETELLGRCPKPESFDDLVDAAPQSVQAWMKRKAFLADGASHTGAVCGKKSVLDAVAKVASAIEESSAPRTSRQPPRAVVLRAGLLRDLANCPWNTIQAELEKPETTCRRLAKLHRELLESDPGYRRIALRLMGQLRLLSLGG